MPRATPTLLGLLGLTVAAALGGALLGSSAGRPPPAPHPAATAAGAHPANGAGDAVICRRVVCSQAGTAVAAPIDGGTCTRGATPGTWTRIDHQAPEPILICLPAHNPPPGSAPPPIPSLVGAQLDRAELALDRLGLAHDTSGGGLFGILDRGSWTVCATSPASGGRLARPGRVKLFVDHSC